MAGEMSGNTARNFARVFAEASTEYPCARFFLFCYNVVTIL